MDSKIDNTVFDNNSIIQDAIENRLKNDINEIILEKDIDFNPLALYFGEDYVIKTKDGNKISIHQPTVQDFIDYGENNIYSVIVPFISNTTSFRVQLWDEGLDWNKVSNQELFVRLCKMVNIEYSKIIFGDIDFTTFDIYNKYINGKTELVLYSEKLNLEIDETTRNKICKYIQFMFNVRPVEEEFTSSKTLKQDLINNDRQKQLIKLKSENTKSNLLSLISFCLNHPGFKYKKNELRQVGIVEFMDSVQRLQIYESTHALINGMYSGFVDNSKIDKEQFDFMRDIHFA